MTYPGEKLLALWDGVSPEPDPLVGVQHGGLSHQPLHPPHTAVHHVNSDLTHLHEQIKIKKHVFITSKLEVHYDLH